MRSLVEGFKDMLRPCRSLDQLAEKQAFLIADMYFHPNAKEILVCYFLFLITWVNKRSELLILNLRFNSRW